MDTDDYTPPSPWRPTTNLLELAVIGKLGEEAGELIEELEGGIPWDAKPIEDEFADVRAMSKLAVDYYGFQMESAPSNGKTLLANLGKLVNVISRCVIQGVDEIDPSTKRLNRDRLQEIMEIVLTQIDDFIVIFDLNATEIERRIAMKIRHKSEWHDQIRSGAIS